MLRLIPYIGFVMAVYALFTLFGGVFNAPGVTTTKFMTDPLFGLGLPSGATWQLSIGDLFVIAGLLALGIESLKSAGTTRVSMGNHVLSMLAFVIALLLFLLVPGFATTTFFLLMVMAFIDTLAGMLISIVTARRDIDVASGRYDA
jgi:hypothetical protein